MKKRLFVSIDLPQTLKKTFLASLKNFKSRELKITPLENLHLTVYFLGYFEEKQIPGISKQLRKIFLETKPFPITFEQIIFAPLDQTPRMIWAVFQSDDFKNLTKEIGEKFNNLLTPRHKLKKESASRRIIPHATLVRFKRFKNIKEMELKQPKIKEKELLVQTCQLMESRLSRLGPKYFLIKTFNLGAVR